MHVLALPHTTIGKKAIMAVTGVVWIGYLALHMWGNLHIFQGAEEFNHYAEFLRTVGEPVLSHAQLLWLIRIVIVVAIALHIWSAWELYSIARRAHGSNYAVKRTVQANYATKFMRIGGVVILLFIIFHLANFTWTALPETAVTPRQGPYNNVVTAFSNPVITLFYLFALVALALHLYHGVWSMFQTLGLNNRDWDGFFRGLAIFVALVIPVGFALVPLAVMFGVLTIA
jgi:succinate dehydrogenase / fumarate reductase, cytochrome b subunit